MTRSIYGMHEHCPLDVMPDGTILYIAEVGDGSDPHPGIDLSNEPRARMIRIQWLFGEHGGCYPPQDRHDGFLQRVGSLAKNTPDCHMWIAGNEPGNAVEGLHSPEYTAYNYVTIRQTIQYQYGHESDVVLFPPIGPWNVEAGYGWIEYFARVIDLCADVDGFALHTYSRGPDPASITSEDKMSAPYDAYYNGFRTYRDWIAAIPGRFADRPIYITETNQNDAWANVNNGWVQAAYKEINNWNQAHTEQPIRCLMLYRWPNWDKYGIEGLIGVIEDFKDAQMHGYEVPEKGEPPVTNGLLLNPDFENGFREVGAGEVKVANDWHPWWQAQDTRPEYKDAAPFEDRIHSGSHAQQWFNTYATHTAGVFQQVANVEPGRAMRLSGWVQAFTRNDDHDFSQSTGRYRMRIGVDPYGGTNAESDDVVWSETVQPYDAYQQLVLDFSSKSDRLTVFAWGQPEWRFKHNNAYLDDLELVYLGDEPEPPDPPVEPPDGECDLSQLYALKAKEAAILSSAYNAIAELYRNET